MVSTTTTKFERAPPARPSRVYLKSKYFLLISSEKDPHKPSPWVYTLSEDTFIHKKNDKKLRNA